MPAMRERNHHFTTSLLGEKQESNHDPPSRLLVLRRSWLVVLALDRDALALGVLHDLGHQGLEVLQVPPDQRDGVVLRAPAGVAADLDALCSDAAGQVRQVARHGALGERRGDEDPVDALAFRVGEALEQGRLEAVEECLDYISNKGKSMYKSQIVFSGKMMWGYSWLVVLGYRKTGREKEGDSTYRVSERREGCGRCR